MDANESFSFKPNYFKSLSRAHAFSKLSSFVSSMPCFTQVREVWRQLGVTETKIHPTEFSSPLVDTNLTEFIKCDSSIILSKFFST